MKLELKENIFSKAALVGSLRINQGILSFLGERIETFEIYLRIPGLLDARVRAVGLAVALLAAVEASPSMEKKNYVGAQEKPCSKLSIQRKV